MWAGPTCSHGGISEGSWLFIRILLKEGESLHEDESIV